jgi:ankyrin repeat protein
MRRTPLLANLVGKPRDHATLRMLIARGADLDLPDGNGITPLMQSIVNNDPVLAQLLIDKGANLSLENKDGDNALAIALKAKENKCQTTILNAAGNDMGSGVLLLYAAQNNNLEQMKRVIEGKETAQRTASVATLPPPDVNFADRVCLSLQQPVSFLLLTLLAIDNNIEWTYSINVSSTCGS